MISLFIKVPILGVLTAFLAVIAEQLVAVLADLIWHQELVFSYYGNLSAFLIAAVVIEETFKYLALRIPLRNIFGLRGMKFVFGSFATGFFFGLTEVWLITISDSTYSPQSWNLNPEAQFTLISIILVQTLTSLLAGSLIASQAFNQRFYALKVLFFPVFIHLLFNFLVIQKGDFTDGLIVITLIFTSLISLLILAFNFKKLD